MSRSWCALLRLPDICASGVPKRVTARTIDEVRTAQHAHPSSGGTASPAQRVRPTVVATEVLLLRPHGETASPAPWPLFVLVVTEPAGTAERPLTDLLDRHGHANEPTVVVAESAWSVVEPASALLALTVRAASPVPVDLKIVLPASPVLDLLGMVARGAPVGVTTRDRAERLHGRFEMRAAVRDVVLLSSPPPAGLAALADVLRLAREA